MVSKGSLGFLLCSRGPPKGYLAAIGSIGFVVESNSYIFIIAVKSYVAYPTLAGATSIVLTCPCYFVVGCCQGIATVSSILYILYSAHYSEISP